MVSRNFYEYFTTHVFHFLDKYFLGGDHKRPKIKIFLSRKLTEGLMRTLVSNKIDQKGVPRKSSKIFEIFQVDLFWRIRPKVVQNSDLRGRNFELGKVWTWEKGGDYKKGHMREHLLRLQGKEEHAQYNKHPRTAHSHTYLKRWAINLHFLGEFFWAGGGHIQKLTNERIDLIYKKKRNTYKNIGTHIMLEKKEERRERGEREREIVRLCILLLDPSHALG